MFEAFAVDNNHLEIQHLEELNRKKYVKERKICEINNEIKIDLSVKLKDYPKD